MYKYGCNYEHEVFKTTEVLEIIKLMARISKELWTTLDVQCGTDNQRRKHFISFFTNPQNWVLSKNRHDFSNKVVSKLKIPKMFFRKNVVLNFYSPLKFFLARF